MSFVLVALKVCVTLCVLSWYSSGVLKLMDTYFRNEFTKYLKKDLESKANYPRGIGLVASSSGGLLVSGLDLHHQPPSKRQIPSSLPSPRKTYTREKAPPEDSPPVYITDYAYEYRYTQYETEEAQEHGEMDQQETFTHYDVLYEEKSEIVKERAGEYLFTASRLDSPEIDESVSLRTSSPSYLSSHGAHVGGSMTMTATILTTSTTPQQTSESGEEGNQNQAVSEKVNHYHHKPLQHPTDSGPGYETSDTQEKLWTKTSPAQVLSTEENTEIKDQEATVDGRGERVEPQTRIHGDSNRLKEEPMIVQDMCLMKKNEDKNVGIHPPPPSSLSPSSFNSEAELSFCQQDKLEYLDAQSNGNFPSNWGIEISGEECKENNHRPPDSTQHSSCQLQEGLQPKDEYESCNEPPLIHTQESQPENQIFLSQQIIRPSNPPPILLLKARGRGVITTSPESKLITFLFLLISAISFYPPLLFLRED